MHAPREQPCMPPRSKHAHPPGASMHTPPRATMHAPWEQPCTPPGSNHSHPLEQPHTPPGATMHTPPVDRIVDTRFWKYYLAPTSLRAVKTTLQVYENIRHWRKEENACILLYYLHRKPHQCWHEWNFWHPLRKQRSVSHACHTHLSLWTPVNSKRNDLKDIIYWTTYHILGNNIYNL